MAERSSLCECSSSESLDTVSSESRAPLCGVDLSRMTSTQGAGSSRTACSSSAAAATSTVAAHRPLEQSVSLQQTSAAARRGHLRSASQGTQMPGPSILKASCGADRRSALRRATAATNGAAGAGTGGGAGGGHARAFSHGQIGMDGLQTGVDRAASKTDFILPPGHDEQRQHSASFGGGVGGGSSGSLRSRHLSLSGSLFRSHGRQTSRSESIYTLRQQRRQSTAVCECLCFWRRWLGGGKAAAAAAAAAADARVRRIVANHSVPPDTPPHLHPNAGYCDNHVRTTKYTLLTFVPRNLFEQFHRIANLYFLFIVVLNFVPSISAFGKEVAMLPLVFVMAVTAAKDLFEDRRRRASDRRVNGSSCRVFDRSQGHYVSRLWRDVRVGDLVHLSCDELVPADILLLRCSDSANGCHIDTGNLDGETSLKPRRAVAGLVTIADGQNGEFEASSFRGTVECNQPTTKLYRFFGGVILDGHTQSPGVPQPQRQRRLPISSENLVLRECVLKNTDFIEGIVVYAGHETKALLNNGGPRYKRSRLERLMNIDIVYCVVILLVLCFVGATGSGMWVGRLAASVPFFPFAYSSINSPLEGFITFWTFVIILQVLVPMSLYVTMEIAKMVQVYHINSDQHMYDPVSRQHAQCRALNITEELGQVQYVFSDKTGTLTENQMVFRQCTIDGVDYNHDLIIEGQGKSAKPSFVVDANLYHQLCQPTTVPAVPSNSTLVAAQSKHLPVQSLSTEPATRSHEHRVRDFFLLMACCNTVIVAKHPHKDKLSASGAALVDNTDTVSSSSSSSLSAASTASCSAATAAAAAAGDSCTVHQQPAVQQPDVDASGEHVPYGDSVSQHPSGKTNKWRKKLGGLGRVEWLPMAARRSPRNSLPTPAPPSGDRPNYEAESPDEMALVEAAYKYGVRLLRRTSSHLTVALPTTEMVEFQLLHVLAFDSTRKRMSVLVRHSATGRVTMFTKGADSSMLPVLEPPGDVHSQDVLYRTQQQLHVASRRGLRVLVLAKRELSEADYESWRQEHEAAETSVNDRDYLLSQSYRHIETRLTLLGCTGVEDRLQEGVPETLAALREAGIVVWVLTGDKQETAVNIAYSCRLFAQNMQVLKINARSRDAAEQCVNFYLRQLAAAADNAAAVTGKHSADVDVKSGVTIKLRPSTPASTSLWSADTSSLSTQTADENVDADDVVRSRTALVVDGKTLTYFLDARSMLQEPFLRLTNQCAAVLCCRTTPLQKACLVRVVKQKLGVLTLAVGDGANDVSMIQTADVGVGISGHEGRQAVMASDFSVARFRSLRRLLLVHGHWCYDRLARMVLYFFYKNATFVFVTFWFQLYCGFSGTMMVDQLYWSLYNLFFTSLPPFALGIYDQDCAAELLMAQPVLYSRGRCSRVYRRHSFWLNMADAFYQSIVIFFLSTYTYIDSDVGLWEYGTTIVVACLFTMLLHACIEIRSWTWIHVASILLSVVVFFVFALVYNSVCLLLPGLAGSYWVIMDAMATPAFHLIYLLASVTACLPRLMVRVIVNTFCPSAVTWANIQRHLHSKSQNSVHPLHTLTMPWSSSTSLTSKNGDVSTTAVEVIDGSSVVNNNTSATAHCHHVSNSPA